MKTLTIKDLSRNEELEGAALAAVRGGMKMSASSCAPGCAPGYDFGGLNYAPKFDSSIHATQDLTQVQNVVNATANGSAFLGCVSADNHVSQSGTNKIYG